MTTHVFFTIMIFTIMKCPKHFILRSYLEEKLRADKPKDLGRVFDMDSKNTISIKLWHEVEHSILRLTWLNIITLYYKYTVSV